MTTDDDHHLSYAEIGRRLGVSGVSVWSWAHGLYPVPGPVVRLMDLLGIVLPTPTAPPTAPPTAKDGLEAPDSPVGRSSSGRATTIPHGTKKPHHGPRRALARKVAIQLPGGALPHSIRALAKLPKL